MTVDVRVLFERQQSYPNPDARDAFDRLVGLDDQKTRLRKILSLLVYKSGLKKWREQHHPGASHILDSVLRRPPLVILAGDVGSGKTALAESIGDAVARDTSIEVTLLPLSLAARGQGRIGEMTQLISAAFDFTVKEANAMMAGNEARGAVILLVDEADALAQSRATAEMHHEDVSGVNAFIRGIDRLSTARLPAAAIMCTNRYEALDPAVKRRAAEILSFDRPGDEQRRLVLGRAFEQLGFSASEVDAMIAATGPRDGRVGFTYSDLVQRLIPAIVLDAYPQGPITPARAIEIAQQMQPTAPFVEAERRGN